jgi:hypothetical protein
MRALGPWKRNAHVWFSGFKGTLFDSVLHNMPYISRDYIQHLIRTGAVFVNNWRVIRGTLAHVRCT